MDEGKREREREKEVGESNIHREREREKKKKITAGKRHETKQVKKSGTNKKRS